MADFVKCGNRIVLNRDHVVSCVIDEAPHGTYLYIKTTTGEEYKIDHSPYYTLDGVDVYKIRDEILGGKEKNIVRK